MQELGRTRGTEIVGLEGMYRVVLCGRGIRWPPFGGMLDGGGEEERSDGGVIDEVGREYSAMWKVEYFGYWRVLGRELCWIVKLYE